MSYYRVLAGVNIIIIYTQDQDAQGFSKEW